jgi:hypothetical protein
MTVLDGQPAGHKGEALENIGAQPEKRDRFPIKTPSTFVKRPMRERKGGGPVIFVGVASGRAASQLEREARTDPTT